MLLGYMNKKKSYINLHAEFAKFTLPDVEKPRASDTDFVVDLVDVSNLVNKLLAVSASLVPDQLTNKLQQGVLLGHMVRMFKLYNGFLLLVIERRIELALLAVRALTETSIILKYLTQNINDDLCKKFIKSSLGYEKKLLDFIQKKLGNSEPSQFDSRIIESIKRKFAKAGFKPEEIDFKKDKDWHENLFDLAGKVGFLDYYETMYRSGSRAEHGSWDHLEDYHLIENEHGYLPDLRNSEPNPQMIINPNIMCLGTILDYCKYIVPEEVVIPSLIPKLIEWHLAISKKRNDFQGASQLTS